MVERLQRMALAFRHYPSEPQKLSEMVCNSVADECAEAAAEIERLELRSTEEDAAAMEDKIERLVEAGDRLRVLFDAEHDTACADAGCDQCKAVLGWEEAKR